MEVKKWNRLVWILNYKKIILPFMVLRRIDEIIRDIDILEQRPMGCGLR